MLNKHYCKEDKETEMKKNYLTAQQAKALAAAAHDIDGDFLVGITEDILKLIHGAATSGKTVIEFGIVHEIVIRRLEHLGFVVRVSNDQREGMTTTISWN